MQIVPYFIGIVALLVLLIIYRMFAHTWDVTQLYEGTDGKSSSSKVQWFLWTLTVIFAYVVLYAARVMHGDFQPTSEIPVNVLLAMGFSITTMATAKGITASYVASGRIFKLAADSKGNPDPSNRGGIFLDDDGYPDLSKIQMIAWTLIAIVTYLFAVANAVQSHPAALPDIDSALMVLMGLGQGAYLGKKLTTSDQARLTGLSVANGKPGIPVKIAGLSFGSQQNGSFITIDGDPFPILIPAADWTDSQVAFTIPTTQPGGAPWPAGGQKIMLGLIVGGMKSANELPFNVTP